MSETLAERMASFALETRFEELPTNVVVEARRRLLDSLGCAVGALAEPAPTIVRPGRRAIRGIAIGLPDRRLQVGSGLGGVLERRPHPLPRLQRYLSLARAAHRATTGRPSWPPGRSPAPMVRHGSPPPRSPTRSSAASATPPASAPADGTTQLTGRSRRRWPRPACSGSRTSRPSTHWGSPGLRAPPAPDMRRRTLDVERMRLRLRRPERAVRGLAGRRRHDRTGTPLRRRDGLLPAGLRPILPAETGRARAPTTGCSP